MDTWVVSNMMILHSVICDCVLVNMCAFLLGKREGVELLGHGVCLRSLLVDTVKQFSNMMYYIPTGNK